MTFFPVTWRRAIVVSFALHLFLLFTISRLPHSQPTPFPQVTPIRLVSANETVDSVSDRTGATNQPSYPPPSKAQLEEPAHQTPLIIKDSRSTFLTSSEDLKESLPVTEEHTGRMGNLPASSDEAPIAGETGHGDFGGTAKTTGRSDGTPHAPSAPVYIKPSPLFIPLTRITRMPVFKRRVDPIYPEEARRLGKEGVVLLEVGISDTGKVIRVDVIQPMGYGFDEAARTAIAQSEFEPAQVAEVPVAVIVRMPIRFRFKD